MKEKAQLSLEALIALSAFIVFLALIVHGLNFVNQETIENTLNFNAKSEALECALITDSINTNNNLKFKELDLNCFFIENKAYAFVKGTESSEGREFSVELVNGNKNLKHYGERN
ncbi:MAG: hypothetical protein ABH821_05605 [archaeon]